MDITELILGVNIVLGTAEVSACASLQCDQDVTGVFVNCLIVAVNNALNGCGLVPTPTPAPTPILDHGHTCCECGAATCTDFAWVEVERACPTGCRTFLDAQCQAPCRPGPVTGAAVCVPLTPCTTDADCDDGNGCTADHCTIDGCVHECLCV